MNKAGLYVITLCLFLQSFIAWGADGKIRFHDLTEIIRGLAPTDGQTMAHPSIDLDIRFAFDSARLSAADHRQLDELGKALTSDLLKDARIGIYGHTDATGNSEYNQGLSRRRAHAVADYLVRKFPIRQQRLEIAGHGEQRLKNPMAPNAAENRRVQILNLSAQPWASFDHEREHKIRW
jgi:outer membrane protein OmpA-like peptidoglycan-associated protein